MYSQGEINEFNYIEKGSWVIGQLTDKAINSEEYSIIIQDMVDKKIIKDKSEFRITAKVVSLKSFQEQLESVTGESIEINSIKSTKN